MSFSGPDQAVTSIEKMKLLGFLKRSHGKADSAAEGAEAPKKITLNRRKVQEITVAAGRTKSTVAVEVRQKRTYVNPTARPTSRPPAPGSRSGARGNPAQARGIAPAQPHRAAEARRGRQAPRRRTGRAQAPRGRGSRARCAPPPRVAAVEVAVLEDTAKPKAGHHGHPKPAPPRVDDKGGAHKAKPNRGSHAMVAGVEDDDSAARFAGQLHLSASERARRSTSARGKPKPTRRLPDQKRQGSGEHGFQRPTEKIVREVVIGDAITVSDLAQKLALKGGDVVKALFKMGVMATITQTIDHDTAVLVVEELGHTAVHADAGDVENELLAHVEEAQGEQAAASAGRHHHGPRRPRQDLAARLHPPHQGRHRRSRRHHPAHRRVPRRNRQGRHQLPRYAGPCGVLADACARRQAHRHRGAGGRGRRRRDAADDRSGAAREVRGRAADRRDQQDGQVRRRSAARQERTAEPRRGRRGFRRRHADGRAVGQDRHGRRCAARCDAAAGRSAGTARRRAKAVPAAW